MITDVFLMLVSALLFVPLKILQALTWVLPHQATDALTYFLSFLLYWRGWWNINAFLDVDIAFLTFSGVYYIVMLTFSAWAAVPWVGRRFKKPTISTKPGK